MVSKHLDLMVLLFGSLVGYLSEGNLHGALMGLAAALAIIIVVVIFC